MTENRPSQYIKKTEKIKVTKFILTSSHLLAKVVYILHRIKKYKFPKVSAELQPLSLKVSSQKIVLNGTLIV